MDSCTLRVVQHLFPSDTYLQCWASSCANVAATSNGNTRVASANTYAQDVRRQIGFGYHNTNLDRFRPCSDLSPRYCLVRARSGIGTVKLLTGILWT